MIFKSDFNIELKNGAKIRLSRTKLLTLIDLLGVISFATSCIKGPNNTIELSLDTKNRFVIPLDKLSYEDENLLGILFSGSRFGAHFLSNENEDLKLDGHTLKITEINGKKVVETSNGLKFYLDSITPSIIAGTFIRRTHNIDPFEDFNGKVVVDVGAECGDTPIYYASRGAKVFAFEPIKAHYDAMVRNISLNPHIADKIIPINAAIGQEGILKFHQSSRADIAETPSFVFDTHGKSGKTSEVKGYTLHSAYREFKIDNVHLLKMDCKGCEWFMTDDDLKNVASIKLEWVDWDNAHKFGDLLALLKRNGFKCISYRNSPIYYRSNSFGGLIYGKKFS